MSWTPEQAAHPAEGCLRYLAALTDDGSVSGTRRRAAHAAVIRLSMPARRASRQRPLGGHPLHAVADLAVCLVDDLAHALAQRLGKRRELFAVAQPAKAIHDRVTTAVDPLVVE